MDAYSFAALYHGYKVKINDKFSPYKKGKALIGKCGTVVGTEEGYNSANKVNTYVKVDMGKNEYYQLCLPQELDLIKQECIPLPLPG